MERPIKIILYIIVGILVINLLMTLFGNSNVKSIRQDLEQARRSSDSALNELRFSQQRLDSISSDMNLFKAYIDRIENTVSVNDAEKRLKEEKNSRIADSLRKEIQRRRQELAADTLPDIEITPLHQ